MVVVNQKIDNGIPALPIRIQHRRHLTVVDLEENSPDIVRHRPNRLDRPVGPKHVGSTQKLPVKQGRVEIVNLDIRIRLGPRDSQLVGDFHSHHGIGGTIEKLR